MHKASISKIFRYRWHCYSYSFISKKNLYWNYFNGTVSHEKSMPFHHVRCCFGSIEWSANWRYIFAIFLYKNRLTDCLHFAPLRIQIGVRWCPSTIHYYLRWTKPFKTVQTCLVTLYRVMPKKEKYDKEWVGSQMTPRRNATSRSLLSAHCNWHA